MDSAVLRSTIQASQPLPFDDSIAGTGRFGKTTPSRRGRAVRCELWELHAGFVSIAGRRSVNEDSGYASIDEGLFLIADGVGGHVGGTVASHLLVDTIPPFLAPAIRDNTVTDDDLLNRIQDAVYAAQRNMQERANHDPGLAEMGSTLALGVIADQKLLLTHLGDSRVYLIRRGTIRQLTKDHSLVQALIDAGCLTAEQAKNHIFRHVISESVSARRKSPVKVTAHELLPGDRLLFATDGLTDVVDEDLLGWTVTSFGNPQCAAERLVGQALEDGARDNVTCMVVHMENAN
jgi:protein phosphatase